MSTLIHLRRDVDWTVLLETLQVCIMQNVPALQYIFALWVRLIRFLLSMTESAAVVVAKPIGCVVLILHSIVTKTPPDYQVVA